MTTLPPQPWFNLQLTRALGGTFNPLQSPVAGESLMHDGTEWTKLKSGVYSTSATDTGQVWVSGDVIWRKVFTGITMPNAATVSTAHSISSLVGITKMYGVAVNGSSNFIPIPYVDSAAANFIQMQVDTSNIKLTSAANFSSYSGFVVLEYIL